MTDIKRGLFHPLFIYLALFYLLLPPAHAEEERPVDAVVIMDSSGSMKQTDPKELRKPAAKLFLSLLDDTDKASVVSFSSQAWPITFLTPLNTQKNLDKSLRATDRVSHKGIYTNIHAAITKGIELLKESDQQNRDPIIILMTDGQIDVGNDQKSAELRRQILEDLVPRLIEHNIKIYSIAFTEESDQALMQEISDATDGRYALAASDDVLHKVFSKIFEQAKQPDMLPLKENTFVIDSSIREITIMANKASEKSLIYLQTPTGEKINSSFKSETLKWFVSNSFDMITIQNPPQGEWKILYSDDDNKAYIVTDIKLRTRFAFNEDSYYPELIIRSWFEQGEQTEANQLLLDKMQLELEIEHPDRRIETFPIEERNENGEFVIRYKPEMDGFYGAAIIATSKTFQRQQIFSFSNTMPAEPEPLPEPEPAPTPAPEPPVVDQQPEPVEEDATEEKEEDDLAQTLMVFGIVNLVIIFLGLNGFLIFKYMRKK